MLNFFNSFFIYCDVPTPWGVYFQDSASPIAEGIHELHDSIMWYMLIVLCLVTYILFSILNNFRSSKNKIAYKYLTHGSVLEVIWTIFPAVVLILIAYPSFLLLYLSDDVIDPVMTVKAIGYQWYWVYEYSDFITQDGDTIQLESYFVPEDMLEIGQLRLLDVDNRLVLPIDTHIRIVVTGGDVIHCFFVNSLGIKIDATPGRLNQVSTMIEREGVYYGQCAELCGVAHSEMPIVVEAVNLPKFIEWLKDAS